MGVVWDFGSIGLDRSRALRARLYGNCCWFPLGAGLGLWPTPTAQFFSEPRDLKLQFLNVASKLEEPLVSEGLN